MVTTLMMSAKMATLAFSKIKVFWNKVYDVIIFVYDVAKQILSPDSSCIVDLIMWSKFGNSSSLKATRNCFFHKWWGWS